MESGIRTRLCRSQADDLIHWASGAVRGEEEGREGGGGGEVVVCLLVA